MSPAEAQRLVGGGALRVTVPIYRTSFNPDNPRPPDAVEIYEPGKEPRTAEAGSQEHQDMWRSMRRRWGAR